MAETSEVVVVPGDFPNDSTTPDNRSVEAMLTIGDPKQQILDRIAACEQELAALKARNRPAEYMGWGSEERVSFAAGWYRLELRTQGRAGFQLGGINSAMPLAGWLVVRSRT